MRQPCLEKRSFRFLARSKAGKPLKICTYVMTNDTGLAPNPFWDVCTLAICTPNHRGAKLDIGDWIAGFLSRTRGGGLVYAMRVDEILNFDDYYRDERYRKKKPTKSGPWPKPVGDNMYYLDERHHWRQHPTNFHVDMIEVDTENPYVFVASEYYYFGENRLVQELPEPANRLENYWLERKVARGTKYFRDTEHPDEVRAFVDWLRRHGNRYTSTSPIDMAEAMTTGCGSGA